jgi:hypothetical protein
MNAIAERLLMALDPVFFAERQLGFHPDPWQADLLRSDARRAILLCSRQSGKSTVASLLALHTGRYQPESLILLVSPSLRQSSELFKKVLSFLNRLSERPELVEENRLSLQFANGSRIVSLPSSQATIRGFSGASLIVEDESSRVSDELHVAIRPMLATSNGRLVLMSTPNGRTGHFYQLWTEGGSEWQRVMVKATNCPRISRDFLEEERRSLGPRWYAQEYECSFEQTESGVFDWESIQQCIVPSRERGWLC